MAHSTPCRGIVASQSNQSTMAGRPIMDIGTTLETMKDVKADANSTAFDSSGEVFA